MHELHSPKPSIRAGVCDWADNKQTAAARIAKRRTKSLCEFLKTSVGVTKPPEAAPPRPCRRNRAANESSSAPVSRYNYQLFALASQFRTTDIGLVSACLTFVLMRNSCPSGRTS